jgi:hypothetical protein
MAEWSEDYIAAIGPLNFGIFGKIGLNWRLDGALRWKVETASWEGRKVVRGKPAPPRL